MQRILSFLLVALACIPSANGQTDPTKTWVRPLGGVFSVTKKSPDWGPTKVGVINIAGRANSTMYLRIISDSIGALLVQSGKTVLLNTRMQKGRNEFVLDLPTNDSVMVAAGAELSATDHWNFACQIGFFDKKQRGVRPKGNPAAVFRQLLDMVPLRFTQLQPPANTAVKDAFWDEGFFGPKRAETDVYGFTQYYAHGQSEADAVKLATQVTKDVTRWLAPYAISDIKFFDKKQLEAKSNYLWESAQVFTKTEGGRKLFTVTVFTRQDEGIYSTGVNIEPGDS